MKAMQATHDKLSRLMDAETDVANALEMVRETKINKTILNLKTELLASLEKSGLLFRNFIDRLHEGGINE